METWKHLRAILLLPFTATLVIRENICPHIEAALQRAAHGHQIQMDTSVQSEPPAAPTTVK